MPSILKKALIIISKTAYALFCTLCTLFVCYLMFLVTVIDKGSHPFQVIFFAITAIVITIGLWTPLFIKLRFILKIVIFLAFFVCLKCLALIPAVKWALDVDMCMDSGTCAEGIKTKIDGNLVEINKENCLKYNKVWNEKRKWCDIRKIIEAK